MISAKDVNELRQKTGAGMMDCKKALTECNGDIEAAIDWLREKGISKAAKKADRIAAEGLANIFVNGNKAAIIEVNCETDFVTRNADFVKMVDTIGNTAVNSNAKSLEEVLALPVEGTEGDVTALIAANTAVIGEKLSLRRVEVVDKKDTDNFGSYIHMGGKIATLVVLEKEDAELARGLAMHIAANAPKYVKAEDIPADVIAHERAIALENMKNDPKMAGKPEAMLNGIADGKVKKLLAESVLGAQVYLLDGEKAVAQVLKEKGNNVVKFIRFAVGEGIEKRKDDFAAEVMSQIN